MKNHEFAMRAAQIAKRAVGWSHDVLVCDTEYLSKDMMPGSAKRFCDDIREMLSDISPE